LSVLQLAWLGATFVGAACISLVLTPLIIRAASALRLYDAPDGVRRLHDSPVPRLGGVAVYLSAAVVSIVVILLGARVFWTSGVINDYEWRMLTGLLFGSAILFTVGLIDDVRPLPPSVKFAAQVVAALIAFYFGVRLNRATLGYGEGVRVGILSAPLILLWIIGVTNAYNLIDGLNGLAGGIALVACATILAVSLGLGNTAVLIPAAALTGSLFGFLRFNFPKARIFLGDAGSMSIGFLLAVLLLKAAEVPGPSVLVVVPILAMCVPLLDLTLAMIRRWLRGVPLSGADARHIHHRLMALGLTDRRTAIVLWCLAAAMAAFGIVIALSAPYVATSIAIAALVGLSILIIYGTNLLSYDELIVAGEVLLTAPSRFRRVISDQILAHDLTARIQSARAAEEVSELLTATAPSFGFLKMELVREALTARDPDDEVLASWAWKLEYPLLRRPERGPGPAYKLAIWCSAEVSVRPYGAERAAKIIAPGLERWLLGRSPDMTTPHSGSYPIDEVSGIFPGRRSGIWRSRAR
jgi:UDP-GlcNAc:undecaprenyl-phosphate/decaprenyl-phosphate GlcNAc-1-phosphate transferase